MASGREDWQSHRQDMQGNRQDWRTNNREDWQNWAEGNMHRYGGWYHGPCTGGWYPGAGWGYMWDNYPVAAAFGLTAWGVNRVAYGWGYWGYSNPYAGSSTAYDYSQPLVVYNDNSSSGSSGDGGTSASSSQPQATPEGKQAFDEARREFYNSDYVGALRYIDKTLETMPHDTVVHEFRGLVLFALKKYSESAAEVYAVLAAGPGWDWTTVSKLYPNIDVYAHQLRALEGFTDDNPDSPDAHFLVGYHYMTASHTDRANLQFKLAHSELPKDHLLSQLVSMTTSPDAAKEADAAPPEPPTVPADKVLKKEELIGSWKASKQDSEFQLDLGKDGSFTWTYTKGQQKQSMTGVFAIDQNNLALEPKSGGTMLAEVDFANPSQFEFKMVSGDSKDPGLQFNKS